MFLSWSVIPKISGINALFCEKPAKQRDETKTEILKEVGRRKSKILSKNRSRKNNIENFTARESWHKMHHFFATNN